MSNFEDKLNGLIKQIDAYLDIQKDQSILSSERSSAFMYLQQSTERAQHKLMMSHSRSSSLKQTFGRMSNHLLTKANHPA